MKSRDTGVLRKKWENGDEICVNHTILVSDTNSRMSTFDVNFIYRSAHVKNYEKYEIAFVRWTKYCYLRGISLLTAETGLNNV